MIKVAQLIALAIALLGTAPVSADIAPWQFIASGVVPKNKTPIRMEKAEVEIIWGAPCSLIATFTMVNPTTETQTLELGFPMPPANAFQHFDVKPDPLTMTFDGRAAEVTPPTDSAPKEHELVWYRATHSFQPGPTVVTVKAPMRASVGRTQFHESLHYYITSGGHWGQNIGEESVTIRFPDPIAEHQITYAAPADSKIEGHFVRWHFRDFEPTNDDFNINLTYIRPDVMRTLIAMRQEAMDNPDSSTLTIKLARNLFALGAPKSNSGYPPPDLSAAEYSFLLPRIISERHRKIFTEHYQPGYQPAHNDIYIAVSNNWTDERIELVQILADAGFRDDESKTVFILEAESLIKGLLKREPHNAEAWNVYLANYWRTSFAAVGHWFGRTRFSQEQIQTIENAANNCPRDECIQDWLALTKTDGSEFDALRAKIEHAGYARVDLPTLEY